MGYVTRIGNSSTETKAVEDEHGHLEISYEGDGDQKARSDSTLGGV